MTKLPRGITGFRSGPGLAQPMHEQQDFLRVCHAAARAHCGRVGSCEVQRVANYYAAELAFNDHSVVVLCNREQPLLAVVDEPRRFKKEYINIAGVVAEELRCSGLFTLLDAAFLSQQPSPELLAELAEEELKQVRYWRPTQVGDIIFNEWD